MGIEMIMEASRAGMQNERLRMDQSSRNIALANTPVSPQALQQRQAVSFASKMGEPDSTVPQATRTVRDPSHPMADARGFVHYPAVDMVQEMTTMLTASRGYEANVRSFNVLRSMVLRALELGAK
jgi:flagellar basal-body rod protein FlgC